MKALLLIVLGFILGQGAMFLAQTYLIINQEFELVASVGIGVGLLSLVQWVSDGGGVFITSKLVEESRFHGEFTSFSLARAAIGILFSGALIGLTFTDIINEAVKSILYFSPIIGFLWAFNLTGLADNKEKNKYLGPLSGLPWFLSAMALILLYEVGGSFTIVGLAYSLGIIILIIVQYLILRKELDLLALPTKIKIFELITNVIQYNIAYIFSQGYARTLPIIVDNFLGQKIAGIFIYTKNFINAVGQLIIFTRRIEFSNLVKQAKKNLTFSMILKYQKLSLVISTIFLFLLSIIYIVFNNLEVLEETLLISKFLTILAALQILWVVSSSYGQLFVARGMLKEYSLVISLSSVVCMLLVSIFIVEYGIMVIFTAEFFMFFSQIIAYRTLYIRSQVS